MTTIDKLGRLKSVTEARLSQVRAKLQQLKQEEQALRSVLRQLADSELNRMSDLKEGPDAALLLGVDPKWARWIDQRRIAVNQKIARVRALQEELITHSRKAFGQDLAVQKLMDAEQSRLRQNRSRQVD